MMSQFDGQRRKRFVDEVKEDVNAAIEVVLHRAQYGSPPLLAPSEDSGVSPMVALKQKQRRIQRRRTLLGLPYQEWTR